ncbi:hypothetical protein [Streptomyces sp. SAS_275]|uniref:hypothetical protein n=1 Tax=Streptomyces sp. SAS_275 TaxID=3412746 RepID=UPI00403C91D9
MLKRVLLQELRRIAADKGAALVFVTERPRHDVYELLGIKLPVPRKREIAEWAADELIEAAKGA